MPISQSLQKSEKIKLVAPGTEPYKKRQKSVADPRVPLLAGTQLEGYLIGKVLGVGSFSVVYNGTEIETGRHVAVKEYFPKRFAQRMNNGLIAPMTGQNSEKFREGFKLFCSEAKALEKIEHPNVVNMYRLFLANKSAYLVSSYAGGRDLKWFLTSAKKLLDQQLVYKIFLPILSALNCLHNTQTLHLDIKPANILLQPNGNSLLLDFGAARAIKEEDRVGKPRIVTHGFAPPEQYVKNRTLGPWTDIYALAATMYFSIVGKLPCKSKDSSISSSIDIMKYGRAYSSATLESINRALSYEESTRFLDIDHFAEALLKGSEWYSLQDFEIREMGFDRSESSAGNLPHNRATVAA